MSSDHEEEEQVETGLPVTQPEKSTDTEEKPRLNRKNWLNLLFYIFNIVFTFGIGTLGWFGNGTNAELSDKYQVWWICTCVLL
jgi:hypothetical protein